MVPRGCGTWSQHAGDCDSKPFLSFCTRSYRFYLFLLIDHAKLFNTSLLDIGRIVAGGLTGTAESSCHMDQPSLMWPLMTLVVCVCQSTFRASSCMLHPDHNQLQPSGYAIMIFRQVYLASQCAMHEMIETLAQHRMLAVAYGSSSSECFEGVFITGTLDSSPSTTTCL
jgi:hypothetical protein